MSDLNEFTEEANRTAGPCEFALLIDTLDAEVRKRLLHALSLPVKEARNATIAARLRSDHGAQVSWQKVGSHRRGACSCG